MMRWMAPLSMVMFLSEPEGFLWLFVGIMWIVVGGRYIKRSIVNGK